MYKVTVIDQDREEHEYENVECYRFILGALQLNHSDESITIYAPGVWLEMDVESRPKVENGSIYGEQV